MKNGGSALALVLAMAVSVASGDIILDVVTGDVSSVPELADYVTQDLVATTDTDWLVAELIVTLDQPGQIYQDPLGVVDPQSPSPAFFPVAPTWEFDTYVCSGVLGETVSVTPAAGLGDGPAWTFDADALSIGWRTTHPDEIGVLALARVTLLATAQGSWSFLATAEPGAEASVQAAGGVVDGYLVPEPATLGLFALGGLALIRRKRT